MKTLMAILASGSILGAGCVATRPVVRDYKVIEQYPGAPLEDQLNRLSKDGWKVVSSSATKEPSATPKVIVILERQKK